MRTEHFLFQFTSDCNQKSLKPGDTMWGHVAQNIQNYYVSISDSEYSEEEKDWHYKPSDFKIDDWMTDFWLNKGEPEVAEYWLDDDEVKEWFAKNKKAGHVMGIVIMTLTSNDDDNATEGYNFIHMEIDGVPVEKEV
jgi:hypothetical protein